MIFTTEVTENTEEKTEKSVSHKKAQNSQKEEIQIRRQAVFPGGRGEPSGGFRRIPGADQSLFFTTECAESTEIQDSDKRRNV